jgi:hypothetical protein
MATEMSGETRIGSGAPWHVWAVGIGGLLWNAFGGYDYFMTKTRGDAYLVAAGMTPEQIAHFHTLPAWMTAIWAVGVWGALLGSVLLLARRRQAFPVFVASFVAFVLSLVHAYLISPPPSNGPAMMAMQATIFAGCVFFIVYSRRACDRGWLR